MYYVNALSDATCMGCDHLLEAGEICLSQSPVWLERGDDPAVTNALPFVFHHRCTDCSEDQHCYIEYARRQIPWRAPANDTCSYCDLPILSEQDINLEMVYAFQDAHGQDAIGSEVGGGGVAGVRGAKPPASGRFSDLPPHLRLKFRRAGLGGSRGFRTAAEGEAFYEASVPLTVRNTAGTAEYIAGKQASHIEPVANAPHRATDPTNIKWESPSGNQARGAQNMSRWDRAKINAGNTARSTRLFVKGAGVSAARGAVWAALLEFPVSAAENIGHVRRGRKASKDAAKDVGKDVATAGAVGGAVGVGLYGLGALGAGALLAPVAPAIVVGGLAAGGFFGGRRIWQAWRHDANSEMHSALVPDAVLFHAVDGDCPEDNGNCYVAFARDVATGSAPLPVSMN